MPDPVGLNGLLPGRGPGRGAPGRGAGVAPPGGAGLATPGTGPGRTWPVAAPSPAPVAASGPVAVPAPDPSPARPPAPRPVPGSGCENGTWGTPDVTVPDPSAPCGDPACSPAPAGAAAAGLLSAASWAAGLAADASVSPAAAAGAAAASTGAAAARPLLARLPPSAACPADAFAAAAWPANASLSLRTTGASIVDDAERTNSPISWSLAITALLSTPNSLASSYTRTFATTLPLLGPGCPGQSAGPGRACSVRRQFLLFIAACSSSAHHYQPVSPASTTPLVRIPPCRQHLTTHGQPPQPEFRPAR